MEPHQQVSDVKVEDLHLTIHKSRSLKKVKTSSFSLVASSPNGGIVCLMESNKKYMFLRDDKILFRGYHSSNHFTGLVYVPRVASYYLYEHNSKMILHKEANSRPHTFWKNNIPGNGWPGKALLVGLKGKALITTINFSAKIFIGEIKKNGSLGREINVNLKHLHTQGFKDNYIIGGKEDKLVLSTLHNNYIFVIEFGFPDEEDCVGYHKILLKYEIKESTIGSITSILVNSALNLVCIQGKFRTHQEDKKLMMYSLNFDDNSCKLEEQASLILPNSKEFYTGFLGNQIYFGNEILITWFLNCMDSQALTFGFNLKTKKLRKLEWLTKTLKNKQYVQAVTENNNLIRLSLGFIIHDLGYFPNKIKK